MPAPLLDDLRACYRAAVDAVRADALLARAPLPPDLARYQHIVVVGAGKASLPLAAALEDRLADALGRPLDALPLDGVVTVPHGYADAGESPRPRRLGVREAGHPVSDAASEAAAREALRHVAACGPDDLVVVLLSGGGSALWTCPAEGLTLGDLAATNRVLLASGLPIHDVNAVRKHVSALSGGRLAAAAYPATVCAFVLSDVVGDDLATIASGPTVADAGSSANVLAALQRVGAWGRLPEAVQAHLMRALHDPVRQPVHPGDPRLVTTTTHLLGTNRQALDAAADEARRRGYAPLIVTDRLEGEARTVGADLARHLRALPADRRACLLWGGETTVTLGSDAGLGGRNQELALAAACALDGHDAPVALLSAGTDGIDGPTDAAGAVGTPHTAAAARRLGLDPAVYLARHDAYPLLDAVGALLRPGPTHTNVMDIVIGVLDPST